MVFRAEKDRTILKTLSSKFPQFDPYIKSCFTKSGCWSAEKGCAHNQNWPQLCDELRRYVMQTAPSLIMSKELKLHDSFLTMRLGRRESELVDQVVLNHLKDLNPILKHIITVKLVCNQRRNLINIRVRRELLPTIHHYNSGSGLHVLFTMSDELQPYLRIVPIDESSGELSLSSGDSRAWTAIAAGVEQVKPHLHPHSLARDRGQQESEHKHKAVGKSIVTTN